MVKAVDEASTDMREVLSSDWRGTCLLATRSCWFSPVLCRPGDACCFGALPTKVLPERTLWLPLAVCT